MSCTSCQNNNHTQVTTEGLCSCACGCEEAICPSPQPCTEITDSKCIIYTDEPLQCGQDTIVQTNTSLSLVIKAVVDYVCKWIGNKKFENTLPGSVTGTTDESVLSSMFIPANSLEKDDIMRYEMMFSKESTVNGVVAIKAYINSTPDITGSPIPFADFGNYGVSFNPNASGTGTRGLVVLDTATDTKFMPSTLVSYTDSWSIASPIAATAIDWTVNQYIVLTCTPNDIADTVTHIYSKFTK
jgi:hypothetical protein